MRSRLGNAVWGGCGQGGRLVPKAVEVAIHLGARSLIDTGIRLQPLDNIEQARQAANIDIEGLCREVPAGRHEDLTGKVVDLIGRGLGEGDFQRNRVAHIAIENLDLIANRVQPAHGAGLAPHQAINAIAQLQQILGQVAPVLA